MFGVSSVDPLVRARLDDLASAAFVQLEYCLRQVFDDIVQLEGAVRGGRVEEPDNGGRAVAGADVHVRESPQPTTTPQLYSVRVQSGAFRGLSCHPKGGCSCNHVGEDAAELFVVRRLAVGVVNFKGLARRLDNVRHGMARSRLSRVVFEVDGPSVQVVAGKHARRVASNRSLNLCTRPTST